MNFSNKRAAPAGSSRDFFFDNIHVETNKGMAAKMFHR